jgi:hypothetical protein
MLVLQQFHIFIDFHFIKLYIFCELFIARDEGESHHFLQMLFHNLMLI